MIAYSKLQRKKKKKKERKKDQATIVISAANECIQRKQQKGCAISGVKITS